MKQDNKSEATIHNTAKLLSHGFRFESVEIPICQEVKRATIDVAHALGGL